MYVDFQSYPPVTPLSSPMHNWAEIRPGSLPKPVAQTLARVTSFVSAPMFDLEKYSGHVPTGLLQDPASARDEGSAVVPSRPQRVQGAGDIASQRVQLMAAKYVDNKPNKEVLARLAILDEQLLALSPRVTPEHVAALERIASTLEDTRARRQKRALQFGLSP
jgi:hypothetical protein